VSALGLLAIAWATAAALQLGLWLVSQRTGNAAIVDVGWAGSFALVIGVWTIVAWPLAPATVASAAGVILWSLRLAGYLVLRGAASGPEEGRYRDLRARWSPRAGRAFFVFFQAQAALTGLLCVAFVWSFASPARDAVWAGPAQVVGLALVAIGVVGESLADHQLAAWKRDPHRRGTVCDVGLWSWSRHPNYFFEIVVWVGHAVFALAYPWGGLALLAPTILLASILRVTGIPATEAQALRSRGDAYRAYQARTSALVPWPPRRTGAPS
jgi:steroid 5-alpha reductase family enzyme